MNKNDEHADEKKRQDEGATGDDRGLYRQDLTIILPGGIVIPDDDPVSSPIRNRKPFFR